MRFSNLRGFRHWDPMEDMRRLQRHLNGMLECQPTYPPINVWSNEEGLIVQVEMPGVSPDDIDISVVHKTLTIKGKRPAEELEEKDVHHRNERTSGSFIRSIELPYMVEADKVEASYSLGILRLELPRAEADKPRKITVKTN